MTPQKHLEVIGVLRSYFVSHGIGKIEYPYEEFLDSDVHGLEHCHGMLDRMEQFIQQERMDKVNRWLGFIQGVLWEQRRATLKQLMDQNRQDQQPSDSTEASRHDPGFGE